MKRVQKKKKKKKQSKQTIRWALYLIWLSFSICWRTLQGTRFPGMKGKISFSRSMLQEREDRTAFFFQTPSFKK